MAVVSNGYRVDLPSSLVPDGFVNPAFTALVNPEYVRGMVLNVDRATVGNATKLTTFQNIIGDVTIGLSKQIDDIIVADYIATNDVQYVWYFKKIGINTRPSTGNDFYTNANDVFECEVEVHITTV